MIKTTSWRGVAVRKNGAQIAVNRSTPQIHSTSSTIFGGGVKDPSGRVSEFSAEDDQCPVCKSDRYLNPKLRLLVSACYHKMCESCIDRLFTLGPAPCPICNKTLRKLAFTPQTFEDLTVEKEVTIRRRMAREFNRKASDFPDTRAYNDYLEEVEELTFNLINEIDVPTTEARIAELKAESAAYTELNIQKDELAAAELREEEERERQEKEDRARELMQLDLAEKREIERNKAEIIDSLERTKGNAAKVVAKSRAAATKRAATHRPTTLQPTASARVLRERAHGGNAVPDVPHVPFTDSLYCYEDKYQLRDSYMDPLSDWARDNEIIMRAGGFLVEDAWERAIRFAVAGLDIAPLDSEPENLDPNANLVQPV